MLEGLYVGATFTAPVESVDYLEDAATLVDPRLKAARDSTIEKKRLFQALNSPRWVITGVVASVAVIDAAGQQLFGLDHSKKPAAGSVAVPFVRWLLQQYPQQFADSLRYGDAYPNAMIFGFAAKTLLKVAAFEVFGVNVVASSPECIRVPVKLWHNPLGVYDPIEVLLNAEERKNISLSSVLRYFQVVPPEDFDYSAASQAVVCQQLVEQSQLVSQLVPAE